MPIWTANIQLENALFDRSNSAGRPERMAPAFLFLLPARMKMLQAGDRSSSLGWK
jgi:hypothetical protein